MSQLRILIVDDEDGIRTLLKDELEDLGHIVHEAAEGVMALQKYRKTDYDLIICDVSMPRMNGYEFISNIRDIDKEIKILMLTGCADEETVKKSIELGISGYLLKPFNSEAIKSRISKLFS